MYARRSLLLNQDKANSSELITVFGRDTFDPRTHVSHKLQGKANASLETVYKQLKGTHNEVASQIGKMLGFSYRDFINMADSIEAFQSQIQKSSQLLQNYSSEIKQFIGIAGDISYRRSTKQTSTSQLFSSSLVSSFRTGRDMRGRSASKAQKWLQQVPNKIAILLAEENFQDCTSILLEVMEWEKSEAGIDTIVVMEEDVEDLLLDIESAKTKFISDLSHRYFMNQDIELLELLIQLNEIKQATNSFLLAQSKVMQFHIKHTDECCQKLCDIFIHNVKNIKQDFQKNLVPKISSQHSNDYYSVFSNWLNQQVEEFSLILEDSLFKVKDIDQIMSTLKKVHISCSDLEKEGININRIIEGHLIAALHGLPKHVCFQIFNGESLLSDLVLENLYFLKSERRIIEFYEVDLFANQRDFVALVFCRDSKYLIEKFFSILNCTGKGLKSMNYYPELTFIIMTDVLESVGMILMDLFEGEEDTVLMWQTTSTQTKMLLSLISWQCFFEHDLFTSSILEQKALPPQTKQSLQELYCHSMDNVKIKIKVQIRSLLRRELEQILQNIREDEDKYLDNENIDIADIKMPLLLFENIKKNITKYLKLFHQLYKLPSFDSILLGRFILVFFQIVQDILTQRFENFEKSQVSKIEDFNLTLRDFGVKGAKHLLYGLYYVTYSTITEWKATNEAVEEVNLEKLVDLMMSEMKVTSRSEKYHFPTHEELVGLMTTRF